MWKDYSRSYLEYNKTAGASIAAASLIAALLLSLMCSIFYNIWKYDLNKIMTEEGDWHGRIVGELNQDTLETVANFASVSKVLTYDDESGQRVTDIYFKNMRKTYEDMAKISEISAVEAKNVLCHDKLLFRYLIFDPAGITRPVFFTVFLLVTVLAAVSLVMIIRNAFAVSMESRIHQLGILSTIGATPAQIRTFLMEEALILCAVPVFLGTVCGIGLSGGFVVLVNWVGRNVERISMGFQYHVLVLIITLILSVLTVFFSAWFPARKMAKITPMEALHVMEVQPLKGKKHSPLLRLIFGVEGELAGVSLKARRKSFRMSVISLTLSILSFCIFTIFVTLSNISTRETYFEKYKDKWDVMAVIKDTRLERFADAAFWKEIKNVSGIRDCVAYERDTGYIEISQEQMSPELTAVGGIDAVTDSAIEKETGKWLVKASLVILDDRGFEDYCLQSGAEPGTEGAIMVNQIWDRVNSNFRHRQYIPFFRETGEDMIMVREDGSGYSQKLKLQGYTWIEPLLREEYESGTLVIVMPVSVWSQMEISEGHQVSEVKIRILANEEAQIYEIEEKAESLLTGYSVQMENRVQEGLAQQEIWRGYKIIVGILCMILALIGIAGIFCNTQGFLHQRKREFARYMSIGVTPDGLRKILWAEALVVIGQPIAAAVPFTAAFTVFVIKTSYMDGAEFMAEFPILPIGGFVAVIVLLIGTAYYLGGKKMFARCDLSGVLRDDALS